jgi:hypothetical protein
MCFMIFTVCEEIKFNNCLLFDRNTSIQFLYLLVHDML